MQIDRIYYPIKTLGYGNRIGIWTIGCDHRCRNCSNPELWPSDPARDVSLKIIREMLTNIFIQYPVLEGVTISGGEPFRQATELAELVRFIRRKIHADILVYSGFSIEELEAMGGSARAVLRSVSALVEGRYVEELNDNLPLRGSANQRILVFNQKYEARYGTLQKVQRRVQNVFCGNGAISFGIPLKGYRESISDGLIKRGIITNGA